MQRIVMWGLIAVLALPVIVRADEQPAPESDKNATRPPAPATGGTFEREAGGGIQTNGPGNVILLTETNDSKYWIGLSCAAVDGTLRSQLGLEAGSGVTVRYIADNSPAKEATLVVHDVLTAVRIGDESHKLSSPAQLNKLVQQAAKKSMTFLVLRGGKPLHVAVMPQERNVDANALPQVFYTPDPSGQPPFFRLAGPVVTLTGPPPAPMNLPDDITVVITKSGSQPVRITVRNKDGHEWNSKEKEPAAQPENVSQAINSVMAHLSRLVGHIEVRQGQPVFTLQPGHQVNFNVAPSNVLTRSWTELQPQPAPQPPVTVTYQKLPTPFSLQQRLDEIQKQQEQMAKTLDELRQAVLKSQPQN